MSTCCHKSHSCWMCFDCSARLWRILHGCISVHLCLLALSLSCGPLELFTPILSIFHVWQNACCLQDVEMEGDKAAATPIELPCGCPTSERTSPMPGEEHMSLSGPFGSDGALGQIPMCAVGQQDESAVEVTINPELGDNGPLPAAQDNHGTTRRVQSQRPSLLGKRNRNNAEVQVWCVAATSISLCCAYCTVRGGSACIIWCVLPAEPPNYKPAVAQPGCETSQARIACGAVTNCHCRFCACLCQTCVVMWVGV